MAEQPPPLGGIFISYRRQDNPYPPALLYNELSERFGGDRVFKDVDSIRPGAVFEEEIARALSACTVLLAFIGRTWLTVTDEEGRRRLDDPDDLVRREIEAALHRGIRVVPVLVDKARLPTTKELPASLGRLLDHQALELPPEDFGRAVQRLIATVEQELPVAGGQRQQTHDQVVQPGPAQMTWQGVEQVSNAIRRTIGPNKRMVVIQAEGSPLATTDVLAIASSLQVEDPRERIGADLVAKLTSDTRRQAADGAAIAVLLAQTMISEVLRYLAEGSSPMVLRRTIGPVVEVAIQATMNQAKDVESRDELAQLATTQTGDPEIGEVIAMAMENVGKEGVITVEESNTFGIELETVEGMRFDRGYISPYFMTDSERMEAVLEDPYILIANQTISSVKDLLPLLEKIIETGRPIAVIAKDVEGEALATLVVNKIRGTFKSVAVKAPGTGSLRKAMLADIAILTGGQVISDEVGVKLEDVGLDLLGRARKVVVTKDETTIIEAWGAEDGIRARWAYIKQEIDETDSDYEREMAKKRLARLAGGVGVIRVGAATEVEMVERKRAIERAVAISQAGVQEGIVPGGTIPLVRAQAALDAGAEQGDKAVWAVVYRALEEPFRQIATNAGYDDEEALRKLRTLPAAYGLNVKTGEYVDMFDAGLIDAALVLRVALEHARDTAERFLSII